MASLKGKGGDARAGDAEKMELPEDRDDSMEGKRQVEKRSPPEEAAESLTKRQGHLSVDVETLRSLLAEQSAALLEKVMNGQKTNWTRWQVSSGATCKHQKPLFAKRSRNREFNWAASRKKMRRSSNGSRSWKLKLGLVLSHQRRR